VLFLDIAADPQTAAAGRGAGVGPPGGHVGHGSSTQAAAAAPSGSGAALGEQGAVHEAAAAAREGQAAAEAAATTAATTAAAAGEGQAAIAAAATTAAAAGEGQAAIAAAAAAAAGGGGGPANAVRITTSSPTAAATTAVLSTPAHAGAPAPPTASMMAPFPTPAATTAPIPPPPAPMATARDVHGLQHLHAIASTLAPVFKGLVKEEGRPLVPHVTLCKLSVSDADGSGGITLKLMGAEVGSGSLIVSGARAVPLVHPAVTTIAVCTLLVAAKR